MSKSQKHRQRSPKQIESILRRFQSSGSSQAAFARENGIPQATLNSWLRKAARSESEYHAYGFVPLELPVAAPPTACLEIVAADGLRILVRPGCDHGDLQFILTALRSC